MICSGVLRFPLRWVSVGGRRKEKGKCMCVRGVSVKHNTHENGSTVLLRECCLVHQTKTPPLPRWLLRATSIFSCSSVTSNAHCCNFCNFLRCSAVCKSVCPRGWAALLSQLWSLPSALAFQLCVFFSPPWTAACALFAW